MYPETHATHRQKDSCVPNFFSFSDAAHETESQLPTMCIPERKVIRSKILSSVLSSLTQVFPVFIRSRKYSQPAHVLGLRKE